MRQGREWFPFLPLGYGKGGNTEDGVVLEVSGNLLLQEKCDGVFNERLKYKMEN